MKLPRKFAAAIADASIYENHGVADPGAENEDEQFSGSSSNQKSQLARIAAEAAFAQAAAAVRAEYGVAVIYGKPRIGRQRIAPEYSFWKRPIMAFIEQPESLDLGPTSLVDLFGPSELNFKVTTDTFRAPLSRPSRGELGQLLKSHGYNLKLPSDFSIRDVQKAMKDQRDRAIGFQSFRGKVEVVGDTVHCNGKSFKIQKTGSGKSRIKVGKNWLPLDPLISFLSG